MAKATSGLDTAAVLDALPQLDLGEIRDRIAAAETELEEATAGIRRRIESLRALERIVDVAQNGKPERKPRQPRKPREPKAGTAATAKEPRGADDGLSAIDRHRGVIARYLNVAGASKVAVIADDCKLGQSSVYAAVDHPWFEKQPNGYALSPQGRRAAGATA